MSFCISKKKIQAQGISESLIMNEETMLVQKQGIVTILGSDFDVTSATSSLRRTLSADMSSKKWLFQNGVPPMKKISSSEELSHSNSKVTAESLSSSEGEYDYEEMKELEEVEEERERFQIWSSIQRDKKKQEQQHEKPRPFDIWSSILSQKANDETSKLPPYIHPLVKSKSCLSKKSLEICTESLGSETGSDGFSSRTPSETGDSEEDKDNNNMEEEEVTTVQAREEELQVQKYNYAEKKSLSRSFPPPLPSIRMQSHRDNGRLFLQAVSIPSQNNFCAQRQDGRLVLTLACHPDKDDRRVTEDDDDDDDDDDEEEEEEKDHVEEEEEEEFVEFEEDDASIKQAPILCSGLSSVHRLALMMNKQIEDVNVEQHSPVAQSLPLRLIPSTPTVAAFNAYEYYWQTKPKTNAASIPNPFTHQHYNYSSLKNNHNHNHNKLVVSGDINQTSNDDRQQLLVLRGKNGDYLVQSLKSCKDSRRSFLFWEPYCIAT